jgi:hypothetical protein
MKERIEQGQGLGAVEPMEYVEGVAEDVPSDTESNTFLKLKIKIGKSDEMTSEQPKKKKKRGRPPKKGVSIAASLLPSDFDDSSRNTSCLTSEENSDMD